MLETVLEAFGNAVMWMRMVSPAFAAADAGIVLALGAGAASLSSMAALRADASAAALAASGA